MNQRGWTWIDEDADHSDYDQGRLDYLAGRWSELHNAAEQRMFQQMSDMEEGRDEGPEYDECPVCGDGTPFGVKYTNHHCEGECDYCWPSISYACCVQHRKRFVMDTTPKLYGITCPYCDGKGYDVGAEREREAHAAKLQAARDAEIEVVENMLHALGARMMRPYEHWNEDERYVQYMEEGRFGHYSR